MPNTDLLSNDVENNSHVRRLYEWSPEHYLPHLAINSDEVRALRRDTLQSLLSAVTLMPEVSEVALRDFTGNWADKPELPYGRQCHLTQLFDVSNGRSTGESNYGEGTLPFISSGDATNSIVRLVDATIDREIFTEGGITLTAFGRASIQPWPFLARGNGGSSVRVLEPRFRMSHEELIWFCGQINSQRWRFHYGRMAIKTRIVDLSLDCPSSSLSGISLYNAVGDIRSSIDNIIN